MTNNTHSTTYNPLGNVTITGGGYINAGTTCAVYVGNGPGGPGTGVNYNTATTWSTRASHSGLQVTGDAEFRGNITVKGRNLSDWLEAVDSRLGTLQINPQLEREFQELRALGDAYREAERRFLEQQRIYDILKNTDE
jgi:hypothetical protein